MCKFCSNWSSSSWERLFCVSASAVAEVVVAFLLTAEAAATFLHAAAAFFVSIARSAWMRFSFSISWVEVSSLGEDCPMGTS